MGFVDKQLLLSDAQAFTSSAVSTNAVKLGAAGLDIATGEPMGVTFQVDVAADVANTDETYSFQIVTATASDGTTGQVIIAEREFSNAQAAALIAGERFTLPVPINQIASTATHLAARLELAGTTPSVTATAFLTPLAQVQSNEAPFRSGYTVAS